LALALMTCAGDGSTTDLLKSASDGFPVADSDGLAGGGL
jgi:hypothetical protein